MNKMRNQTYISFSMDDIKLFSQASHDRNPLHLSKNYSRKTPYGQPVVFGVLCGIASLGCLANRSGYIASSISMEFYAPIFLDENYRVEVQENNSLKANVNVFDGRKQLLKLSIQYKKKNINENKPNLKENDVISNEGIASRREASKLDLRDYESGISVKGRYCPSPDAFIEIKKTYNLYDKGITDSQYSALMCSSYLVGMEVPGVDALFSQVIIEFNDLEPSLHNGFSYDVQSEHFDKRFNLLRVGGFLRFDTVEYAKLSLISFVRQETLLNRQSIEEKISGSTLLKGKVALVTGGSRGLGSAIVQTLVLHGCTVLVNYHKSHEEAERLRKEYDNGSIILVPGDISDLNYCEELKKEILEDYGKLDFLFLNASPALLPLWVEPDSIQRINSFLMKSFSMVSVPMATFTPLLDKIGGQLVFISSSVVQEATPDWPHYAAAKSAIEGLVRTSAIEYPNARFAIARFKRLLTDLTNTPLGRKGAKSPELAAVNLVEEITSSLTNRSEVNVLDMS